MRTDVPGMVHASRTPGRGHRVGFDRRFEPVDPSALLHPSHDVLDRSIVGDRRDLLVVGEPLFDVVVE